MRRRYEEVDQEMTVHEEYVDEHGLPACDYRILRSRTNKVSIFDKFKLGVSRASRLKAGESKRAKITDILKTVQDLAIQQKREEEMRDKKKKRGRARAVTPKSGDGENAHLLH